MFRSQDTQSVVGLRNQQYTYKIKSVYWLAERLECLYNKRSISTGIAYISDVFFFFTDVSKKIDDDDDEGISKLCREQLIPL